MTPKKPVVRKISEKKEVLDYFKHYNVYSELNQSQKNKVFSFIKNKHKNLFDIKVTESLLEKFKNFEKNNQFYSKKQAQEFYNSLTEKEKNYLNSHIKIYAYQSKYKKNLINNGLVDILSKFNLESSVKLHHSILNYIRNVKP